MEQDYIRTALRANDFPDWILQVPVKQPRQLSTTEPTAKAKQSVYLPYVPQGVDLSQTNQHHQVFTGPPERQGPRRQEMQCGIQVYLWNLQGHICGRDWEISRHPDLFNKTPLTAVGEHHQQFHHNIEASDVKVPACEQHLFSRKICESIEIRTEQPALNRDTGYELPAIYNRILAQVSPPCLQSTNRYHMTTHRVVM